MGLSLAVPMELPTHSLVSSLPMRRMFLMVDICLCDTNHRDIAHRRFQLPNPVGPYTGTVNASQFGPSCPQQGLLGVRSVVDDPSAGIYVTALRAPTEQSLPPSEDCKSHVSMKNQPAF